jgi:hypothetical protein
VLFFIQLLLALVLSSGDFSFHFYGTSGRNTGFLAYLALGFLLFACATTASVLVLRKFLFSLLSVGGFLGLYGLGQSRGIDFFDYVNAFGSNVFGTFGNPNFQSAFMGITAAAALSFAVFGQMKLSHRIGLSALVIIAISNVYLSSEQGYLNFLAGFLAAVLVYLFSKKKIILALKATSYSRVSTLPFPMSFSPEAQHNITK